MDRRVPKAANIASLRRRGMSILGLDRIVDIDKRRKEIKAEDEKLKKERGPLQERILEALAGDGLSSVKTEAGVTVYTRSELWVPGTHPVQP